MLLKINLNRTCAALCVPQVLDSIHGIILSKVEAWRALCKSGRIAQTAKPSREGWALP
jgi:hypothetical protein